MADLEIGSGQRDAGELLVYYYLICLSEWWAQFADEYYISRILLPVWEFYVSIIILSDWSYGVYMYIVSAFMLDYMFICIVLVLLC